MRSLSRTEPITAKQMVNLKKYGFLNVNIIDDSGKMRCSHGPDGKPDHDTVYGSAGELADIAEHLKKIGWDNSVRGEPS